VAAPRVDAITPLARADDPKVADQNITARADTDGCVEGAEDGRAVDDDVIGKTHIHGIKGAPIDNTMSDEASVVGVEE